MLTVNIQRINQRRIIFSLFLLVVLTGIHSETNQTPPMVVNGVLDLQQWDFEKDGSINLNGEWEFYWQKFLSPQFSSYTNSSDKTGLIEIPGYWKGYKVDGESLSGSGYATFIVTVLLPQTNKKLAIKIKDIQTAYSLYIDGIMIAHTGKVGKNEYDSIPDYSSLAAEFSPNKDKIIIMLHVSNFHLRKGGFWESLELGTDNTIRTNHENKLSFEIFLSSSIFIMGLYHLSLFLHRRKDRSALYFGLFCLVITIRALSTGEMYLYQLLPNFQWKTMHRMEYLSFYIGLPLFFMYLRSIFPANFSITALRIVQSVALLFCLFVIIAPSKLYTQTVQIYEIFTLLAGLYSIYILIIAIINKRPGSIILLTGFIFMFLMVLNDVLYSNQLIHTGYYVPIGLLIFIFSQAYLISLLFTRMFQTVEFQTTELENTNNNLYLEISERKKLEQNLIKSHEQLEQSRVGIILGLAKLAEYRDEDTGAHLERIREYSRILADVLSEHPDYREYITSNYIDDLFLSAILHDI